MKRIDELKNQLESTKAEAQAMLDGNKVAEAKAKMEEIKELKATIEIQEALDAEEMAEVQNKIETSKVENRVEDTKKAASAIKALIKVGMGRRLTDAENALLVPASGNGTNGEGYILPQDIKTIINEKVRQYKSFREVLGYVPTTALTGSVPTEDFEMLSELVDFTDGTDGTEATDIKFTNVAFALKEKGAIIPLSNTLLQMTDNDLVDYIARKFAQKAVVTENKIAVDKIKAGKTVKQIADWKALKSSINRDLDEAVKFGTCICTNQDGFDVLDSYYTNDGRPILQVSMTEPTKRTFMGYPVHVFSNAMLPTTGTTTKKAPIFYGNLAEAVKFVDNGSYSFATSEHAGFTKNTTIARVIEHVDVVQLDSSDKVYIVGELPVV